MDPISTIKVAKDTSLALLLAARKRGWTLYYMEMDDLYVRDGQPRAGMQPLQVFDDKAHWYSTEQKSDMALTELDVILMRKDPPFDMEFVYATYILELAQQGGTLVVNHPQALRDINEKMSLLRFPEVCAPTLVTRSMSQLREFLSEQGDIVVKPLDGMGGASIFRVGSGDPNIGVILETLTRHGSGYCMAQRYLPEISQGDKRILLVDGQPVDYALARIPMAGESRGNLAAGGRGEGRPLTERDREIAHAVGPALREMGLLFVGLDVIGDYLTEINVTSPTCVRELDREFGIDIGSQLMDAIESRL